MTSAHAFRRDLLEPALDSLALNMERGRLIHNPDTPEVDSLSELVCALGAREQHDLARLGAALLRKLDALDSDDDEIERALCGNLDDLARSLKDREFNHGGDKGRPLDGLGKGRRSR